MLKYRKNISLFLSSFVLFACGVWCVDLNSIKKNSLFMHWWLLWILTLISVLLHFKLSGINGEKYVICYFYPQTHESLKTYQNRNRRLDESPEVIVTFVYLTRFVASGHMTPNSSRLVGILRVRTLKCSGSMVLVQGHVTSNCFGFLADRDCSFLANV